MADPSMTVSVIIPTFQRREHVVRAVRSALQQTEPPAEVIVVDDGSTDGTAEAMAAFGDRVRYLHQPNAGLSSARNLGVRHASGEIIAFLDSDDRWLPHHLATIVDALSRHPQAVLAGTWPRVRISAARPGPAPALVAPLPRMLIGNLVGAPSYTAVRRDALVAVGGFDERLPASEAYDVWLRLASMGPFSLVRRKTAIKAGLPDSLSRQWVRDGLFLDGREQIGEKAAAALAPISQELGRATESYRKFVSALRAIDRGDSATAARALAESCRLMPERSDEPWLIDGWLGLLRRSQTPHGRLSTLAWAAESWPDPRSDTALGLRLHASFVGLRLRRFRLAVRLLLGSPSKAMLWYGIRLVFTATLRPVRPPPRRG